jgi:acylphosphatase
MPTKHVFVSGKVQGVYFRATTRKTAERLGVDGWVRNLPDGRVEAVVEADEDALEEMFQYLHEGPERARVEGVEVEDAPERGPFDGFEVRDTPSR